MPVIDVHTHGIGGCDTRGANPDDILRIARYHGAGGVDAILPTIYAASIHEMRLDMAAVRKAMEMQRSGREERNGEKLPTGVDQKGSQHHEARILGVHLEGPFLNPCRAGALDRASFLPAEIVSWERLVDGFTDVVKIVTISPELEGAERLIGAITDSGIIVSMGHSDADYNEAQAGFEAGAKGVTHLFNAMRGIHHGEPAISGFALTNPHIYVEVIADPFHLHPKTIELIFSVKKADRIMLVSDSVRATHTATTGGEVADEEGRLSGGSMTVPESADYLIGLGVPRELVERSIGENPGAYLDSFVLRRF